MSDKQAQSLRKIAHQTVQAEKQTAAAM